MMQRTLFVCLRLFQRLAQLAHQLIVEGVEGIGAVEFDEGDVVFYFDDDRLIGHEICFRLFQSEWIPYHCWRGVQPYL